MQGFKCKLVYVCFFEGLVIIFIMVGLSVFVGYDSGYVLVVVVVLLIIVFVWNFIFNGLFECWEVCQLCCGCNFVCCVVYVFGFEGGLVVMLVLLFVWWLGISLWEVLVLDFGLIVFFMIYIYLFNFGFDCVFGLFSLVMLVSLQIVEVC